MRRIVGVRLALTAFLATLSGITTVSSAQADLTPAARTPVVFVHGYTGSASNWVTAISVFRAGGYSGNELFAHEYNSYGDNVQNARVFYLTRLGGTEKVAHLASIAGATPGSVKYATWYSACDGIIIPFDSTVLNGARNNHRNRKDGRPAQHPRAFLFSLVSQSQYERERAAASPMAAPSRVSRLPEMPNSGQSTLSSQVPTDGTGESHSGWWISKTSDWREPACPWIGTRIGCPLVDGIWW